MEIHHQQEANQGEFYILDAQQRKIARLTYSFIDEQSINVSHTFVDETLRGQGIADKLYLALMAFTQTHQLKVRSSCHYIAQKLRREQR